MKWYDILYIACVVNLLESSFIPQD